MLRAIKHIITACSLLIVTGSGSLWAVTNSLSIKEVAGVTTANYPIQIGRPFVAGEIANYPQALVNGTAVPTQADIKQRWSDGSVKHAILAFLIPNLSSGSTVTVTFQNQSSGNNTGLSIGQMQGANFDFNAQMLLTNSSTVTADARTMLSAGAFTAWTSGGIAQTVILADHSIARAYDIGFDANRSFRPIFHATFWPGINKVLVRYIGENANTETLQNQTYSLILKAGNSSPTQVYNKASFTQSAATRWTKTFWIGGAPPAIAIDHNLAYIRETKFVPYYDTSRVVPSGAIATACNAWTSAPKDIGDAGNWLLAMGTGGARPDIGPYPDWTVQWLYTGDKCLRDKALGNAELAASWPIHYREGRAGKIMLKTDSPNSGTGLGRTISLNGRPTANLSPFNYNSTVADKINVVGTASPQGWQWDPAHEPEPGSVIYALTGDFWYLEECWFWVSADAVVDYGPSPIQRGPTGAEGILDHNQTRAEAWELRTRANTAFISPDNLPETSYFTALIMDAIALEEGTRNITTTSFNGNPAWSWGRNQFAPNTDPTSGALAFGNLGITPLHQWSRGSSQFAQDEYGVCTVSGGGTPCSANTTKEAASLFESDYMLYSLGRTKELGYPTDALLTWLGALYTGMLTDPGFNPFIIDNGRVPTVRSDGTYFKTFADLKTGYSPTWQNATSLQSGSDPDGYAAYSTAGISYLTGVPNGLAAWNFMKQNFVSTNSALNSNPKWAILPRTSASAGSCDLNGDGVVDVLDVQASINQVLGLNACTGDLDGNGVCNIVDTQRVINATLGTSCRLGP
jgi:hypothetical protein